jgi:hypothetical protein
MTTQTLIELADAYVQASIDGYTHPPVDSIDTSQERVEKSEESVQMAEPDFCDKNCVWSDHHPDCVLFGQAAPTGEGTR